jgi:hypothetical protein
MDAMKKSTHVKNIVAKIESASTFNEMGDWTMALNEIDMDEAERRALFYEINFPFHAKAEFINGRIYIQEYPFEEFLLQGSSYSE